MSLINPQHIPDNYLNREGHPIRIKRLPHISNMPIFEYIVKPKIIKPDYYRVPLHSYFQDCIRRYPEEWERKMRVKANMREGSPIINKTQLNTQISSFNGKL